VLLFVLLLLLLLLALLLALAASNLLLLCSANPTAATAFARLRGRGLLKVPSGFAASDTTQRSFWNFQQVFALQRPEQDGGKVRVVAVVRLELARLKLCSNPSSLCICSCQCLCLLLLPFSLSNRIGRLGCGSQPGGV
jgi:hypothetical protein